MLALGAHYSGSDAAGPDWSTLPQGIVWCIAHHVDDSADIAALRLTCRRWSKTVSQNAKEWRVRGPVARFHWNYLRGTLYMLCPVVDRLTLALSNRTTGDALTAMFADLNWWSRLREVVLIALRPPSTGMFGPGVSAEALTGLSSLRSLQALTTEGFDSLAAMYGALSCPQLTKLAVRSRRSPFGFICSTSNRALELLTESQKAISQGQPLPRQPWRRRPKQQGQGQGPAGREEQHGAAGGGGGVGAGISEDGSEVEALQEQHGVEDVNPGLDMKELQALFREDVGEANGEAGGGCDVYCDAAAELDGDVVMADMDVGDKGPLLRLCGGASVVAAGSTHTRPPSGGLRHLELYADAHLTDGQSVMSLLDGVVGSNALLSTDSVSALLAALPCLELLDFRRVPLHAATIRGPLANLTCLTELRVAVQDGRPRRGSNERDADVKHLALKSLTALAEMTGPRPQPLLLPQGQQQQQPQHQTPNKQHTYINQSTFQHKQPPCSSQQQASGSAMNGGSSAVSTASVEAVELNMRRQGPLPGPGRPTIHLYVSNANSSSPAMLFEAMLPLVPRLKTLFLSHRSLNRTHLVSVGQLTSLECLALALEAWPASGADVSLAAVPPPVVSRGMALSITAALQERRRIKVTSRTQLQEQPYAMPQSFEATSYTDALHAMETGEPLPNPLLMSAKGNAGVSLELSPAVAMAGAIPPPPLEDDLSSCELDEGDVRITPRDVLMSDTGGSDVGAPDDKVRGIGLESLRWLTQLRELHLKGPQHPEGLAAAVGLQALTTNEPLRTVVPPPPPPAVTTRKGAAGTMAPPRNWTGVSGDVTQSEVGSLLSAAHQRRWTQGAHASAGTTAAATPRFCRSQRYQPHGERGEGDYPWGFRLPLPNLNRFPRAAPVPARREGSAVSATPTQVPMAGGDATARPPQRADTEATVPASKIAVPGGAPKIKATGSSTAPTTAVTAAANSTPCVEVERSSAPGASVAADFASLWTSSQSPSDMMKPAPMKADVTCWSPAAGASLESGGVIGRSVCTGGTNGCPADALQLLRPSGPSQTPTPEMQELAAALALAAAEWEGPAVNGSGAAWRVSVEALRRLWMNLMPGNGQLETFFGMEMVGSAFSARGPPDRQGAGGGGSGGERWADRHGRSRHGGGGGVELHGGELVGMPLPLQMLGQIVGNPLLQQHRQLLLQHQNLLMRERSQLQQQHPDTTLQQLHVQPVAPRTDVSGNGHGDEVRRGAGLARLEEIGSLTDMVSSCSDRRSDDDGSSAAGSNNHTWLPNWQSVFGAFVERAGEAGGLQHPAPDEGDGVEGTSPDGPNSMEVGLERQAVNPSESGGRRESPSGGRVGNDKMDVEATTGGKHGLGLQAMSTPSVRPRGGPGGVEVGTPRSLGELRQLQLQALHARLDHGDDDAGHTTYAAHALEDLARDRQMLRRAVLSLQRSDLLALRAHGSRLEALSLHFFQMHPSVVNELTAALPRLRRLSLRWDNDQETPAGGVPCSCGGDSSSAKPCSSGGVPFTSRGTLEIADLPPLLENLDLGGPVDVLVTAANLGRAGGSQQAAGPMWLQLRQLSFSNGIGLPHGALPALLERTPHITELQLQRPRSVEPFDLAALEPLNRLRCLIVDFEAADMECQEVRRDMARGISRLAGLTALQELRWNVPDPIRLKRMVPSGKDDKVDHHMELCQQLPALTGLQRLSLLSLPSCRHLLGRLEELQALRHMPFLEISA